MANALGAIGERRGTFVCKPCGIRQTFKQDDLMEKFGKDYYLSNLSYDAVLCSKMLSRKQCKLFGPGSPSVKSNMVASIEQHVDWITKCLRYLRDKKIRHIDAYEDAENDWVEHVNQVADATLYPRANSWYVGANIPGKPRVFMPYVAGLDKYRKICDEVAVNDYRGFSLKSE